MSGITTGVVQDAADADGLGGQLVNQDKRRIGYGQFAGAGDAPLPAQLRKAPQQFRLVFDAFEQAVSRNWIVRGDEQPGVEFIVIRLG